MSHHTTRSITANSSNLRLPVRANLLMTRNQRLFPLHQAPSVFILAWQGYQVDYIMNCLCVTRGRGVTIYTTNRAAMAPRPAGGAGGVPVGAAVHGGGVDDGVAHFTLQHGLELSYELCIF